MGPRKYVLLSLRPCVPVQASKCGLVTSSRRRRWYQLLQQLTDYRTPARLLACSPACSSLPCSCLQQTLVVFTADNGGIGKGNNHGLRGHKHDPWQGGTRATGEPLVAKVARGVHLC